MKLICTPIALAALLIGSTCLAEDTPKFEGIWHQKIRMIVARADIFTSLQEDGTCFQIARGRAFGKTEWMYMECSWSASSEELMLTVTRSPGVDGMIGRELSHQVLSASAERIVLQERDEELEWTLVENLSEEFEEKLQEYLNDDARWEPNGS